MPSFRKKFKFSVFISLKAVTIFPQVIKTEVGDLVIGGLLVKLIVIYDSKYGNTRRVAEMITDGIKEVSIVKCSFLELS